MVAGIVLFYIGVQYLRNYPIQYGGLEYANEHKKQLYLSKMWSFRWMAPQIECWCF